MSLQRSAKKEAGALLVLMNTISEILQNWSVAVTAVNTVLKKYSVKASVLLLTAISSRFLLVSLVTYIVAHCFENFNEVEILRPAII